jgi:heme A synthase
VNPVKGRGPTGLYARDSGTASGQRIDFTQVLQTEGGKPMTFVLAAENDKMIHWPSRLGAGIAAFLMLWMMVSVLSRVTQNRNVRRA